MANIRIVFRVQYPAPVPSREAANDRQYLSLNTAYSERILWANTLRRGIYLLTTVSLEVLHGKSQIPLRYPGRRQVQGWSQTCSELKFGLSRTIWLASSELAGLRPALDLSATRIA